MGRKKNAVPSLTLHKRTGQGRVRIDGRDFYCGPFGSKECRQRYAELIREHAQGEAVESLPKRREAVRRGQGLLVAELVADYTARRILVRYVDAAGQTTNEGKWQLDILREFRVAVGALSVAGVSGVTLMDVRALMVRRGLRRGTVNKRINAIKRMFKWGLANDLVPPEVFAKVNAVEALAKGDEGVVEDGKVHPVEKPVVDATLPYLSRQIRAVVKLQSLTAARGGEILAMRPGDIDTTHEIWWYRPESHKTQHHGKERLIPLGQQAQEVIKPFLGRPADAYLFSPRDAEAERLAAMRERRKTRVQPSQMNRGGKSRLRDRYGSTAYNHAITHAVGQCNKARAKQGLPPIPNWHPHQLRHAAATAIRKSHGIETASIMLGHSSINMTELYAEKNRDLAQRVAAEIG